MILYSRICFNIPDVSYRDKFVEIQGKIRVGTRFQAVEAIYQELFSIYMLGNCLELTIRAGISLFKQKIQRWVLEFQLKTCANSTQNSPNLISKVPLILEEVYEHVVFLGVPKLRSPFKCGHL